MDGKVAEIEERIKINDTQQVTMLSEGSEKVNNEFSIISNSFNFYPEEKLVKTNVGIKDESIDTNDLVDDNYFDFEKLKSNYLNNLLSWSFLKKISDFSQWPLGKPKLNLISKLKI